MDSLIKTLIQVFKDFSSPVCIIDNKDKTIAFANNKFIEIYSKEIKNNSITIDSFNQFNKYYLDENNEFILYIKQDIKNKNGEINIDYKNFITNAPIGIAVVHIFSEGKIKIEYTNKKLGACLGYLTEEFKEICEEDFFKLLGKKDSEIFRKDIIRLYEHNKDINVELSFYNKNDYEIKMHVDSSIITRDKDNILAVISFFDITDYTKKEEQLTTITKQLKGLMDSNTGGISRVKLNKQLSIVYANDTFYYMRGFDDILEGRELVTSAMQFIYKEDLDRVTKTIDTIINRKDSNINLSYRIKCVNGEIKTILSSGGISYEKDGAYMSCIDIDISSEVGKDILSLLTRDERLSKADKQTILQYKTSVVDRSLQIDYDYVAFLDPVNNEGLLFIMNLTDYGPFNNIKIWDYEKEIKEFGNKFVIESERERYLEETKLEYIVNELKEKDTYTNYFSVIIDNKEYRKKYRFTYLNQNRKYLVLAETDITDAYNEEQRKNDTLKIALKSAEYANQAKSVFLSKMSHEIRTPLNAMLGYLLLLRKEAKNILNDKSNDYINKSEMAGKQLLALINDILDLSSIESGKYKISHEEFDLNHILDNINNLYIQSAKNKNVDLVIKREIMFPVLIGDSLRINQILSNLITNAIKFTNSNGYVKVIVSQIETSHKLITTKFVIEDNGIGMNKEFLSRIFKPFEQQSINTNHKYGGTGLGLSITKNLVELMDGQINVDSIYNEGSTFTVTIPMKKSNTVLVNNTNDIKAEDDTLNDIKFNKEHLLVVEDNEMNIEIITTILEMFNLTFDVAKDGKQAIDMFVMSKENYYKLILMDIMLPNMSGYDATIAIRNSTLKYAKSVPIIAMSANALTEDVTKSLNIGMNDHISKPFEVKKLIEVLRKYLNN